MSWSICVSPWGIQRYILAAKDHTSWMCMVLFTAACFHPENYFSLYCRSPSTTNLCLCCALRAQKIKVLQRVTTKRQSAHSKVFGLHTRFMLRSSLVIPCKKLLRLGTMRKHAKWGPEIKVFGLVLWMSCSKTSRWLAGGRALTCQRQKNSNTLKITSGKWKHFARIWENIQKWCYQDTEKSPCQRFVGYLWQ